MAQRTGIPSIQKVALRMCDLIVKFDLVINVVTNNDPTVLAAKAAALAACGELRAALEPYREYGD